MGWLKRLLGADDARDELPFEVGIADPDEADMVELDVVGEASYQDALARIAGRKNDEGHQHRVGVTLRCDPKNQYDPNAVRVEVMGQLVGFLPRALAAKASPGISRTHGAMEGQGVIVGGWNRGDGDEGHYGIRVWLSSRDAQRIGIARPTPVPDLPAVGPDEVRLSPAENDPNARFSAVTVTCEEHYQANIEATKPSAEWNRTWWPLLATLHLVDANPHAKSPASCIEVRAAGNVVGYLTTKMTERHAPAVRQVEESNRTASVRAHVATEVKGERSSWQIKLTMGG